MQKRGGFLSYFLVFLLLSLLIFTLSKGGFLKPLDSIIAGALSPLESLTYGVFSKVISIAESSELKSLREENIELSKKLIDQKKLIEDNKALSDQFQTQNIRSSSLLPADIIGAPSFISGISVPETLTLDRGENDGVKVGDAVVYKNNLVGRIVKTSLFLSSVLLITNSSSSFTAKTSNTNSLGVVNGQGGGEMILDNVLLSDNLQKGDTVLTKGDINEKGIGFPPDLIAGKIVSVSKNPSDLFQKADLKSLVDITKLGKVFIITNF